MDAVVETEPLFELPTVVKWVGGFTLHKRPLRVSGGGQDLYLSEKEIKLLALLWERGEDSLSQREARLGVFGNQDSRARNRVPGLVSALNILFRRHQLRIWIECTDGAELYRLRGESLEGVGNVSRGLQDVTQDVPIEIGPLIFHWVPTAVLYGGREPPQELKKKEFELLCLLLEQAGNEVSRDFILEELCTNSPSAKTTLTTSAKQLTACLSKWAPGVKIEIYNGGKGDRRVEGYSLHLPS